MSDTGDQTRFDLTQRAEDVFENTVDPVFQELIEEYGDAPGFQVKLVSDGPLIVGIDRYSSIMFKHPNGLEMIVCVYWVSGSERLIAENIRMVTLNKTLDLYKVTRDELRKQITFLAGLELRASPVTKDS